MDVPGSKDPVPAEASAVAQPLAPNPVPATAAPAQDQVSINNHFRKVEDELRAVESYVKTFLKDHQSAENILSSLSGLIEVVVNNIK